ncbi:YfhD family protein [Paenibacillus eucommiae]|uniref:YfhD family protein n=1 Tax=Paenibacillus eucommiae TaxID=1355755 RepID=A0ABS4IZ50_9BACL|nr:YfhD family protein [Paenibacillus eucommiae]MBP1992872.1 hypothetical protein [Paenibacillus eucommiae]
MTNEQHELQKKNEQQEELGHYEQQNIPIVKQEDVEFSAELADDDDLEAFERAEEADNRQEEQ